jgi:dolichol-phosphate mannosyltransferase
LGIAALLFLPVIYWNATHEWVSFAFQTARRVNESDKFSLHLLIGGILALLGPTGLVAVAGGLARPKSLAVGAKCDSGIKWMLFLTLVPLAVYAVFSLTHEPKLNWTGPLWLALMPGLAASLVAVRRRAESNFLQRMGKAWLPTAAAFVLVYGIGLQFLVLGFPGVPISGGMIEVAGWRQLGAAVDAVRAEVAQETGSEPLVVGFDKYNISSEMAFYSERDGSTNTVGQSLFGKTALMYRYWFSEPDQYGKNIILVAKTPSFLHEPTTVARFERVTDEKRIPITYHGVRIGEYAYRVGYRFGPETTRLDFEKQP